MTFQDLMDTFCINGDISNANSYESLLAQMRKNRVTPVIGAGLSCWAGYPTWNSLLTEKAKGTLVEAAVCTLLGQEQYEQAASTLEKFYRRKKFLTALKAAFDPGKLREADRPPYQRLIPRLFSGPVVTTNFDVSLERLLNAPLVITPECPFQEEELRARIQKHEAVLVKLHGSVEDPKHMILTAERYDQAYGSDSQQPDLSLPLPKALQGIFDAAPPLFLGCGLGPDRTCAVLSACKGASGFALLELPLETENRDEPYKPKLFQDDDYLPALNARLDFLDALELQVIWYPHGKHEAVGVLLEQLEKDLLPPQDAKPEAEELLYRGSVHFRGRDALVRQIAEGLRDPAVSLLLVHGVAGIGKTEVCKAAYRLVKESDPAFTMPLVDLAGAASGTAFLDRLAQGLGCSVRDLASEQQLPALLAWLTSGRGGERPLVYLDNYEDVWLHARTEQDALSDALLQLRHAGLRCLVSSQVKIHADRTLEVDRLDGAVRVAGMDWEAFRRLDRVRLFLDTLGREARPAERAALATLTQEMEGHPLSIVLTASYGQSCASLDELLRLWHQVEHHIPGEPERHNSLTRALALAWNGAKQHRAAALRWALHANSLLPLDASTVEELRGFLPEPFADLDWLEGSRRLRSLGLVHADDDAGEGMLLSVKKIFSTLEGAEAFDLAAFHAWIAWGAALLQKAEDRKRRDFRIWRDRALTWLSQCWNLAGRCLDAQDFDRLGKLLDDAGNLYQYDISGAVPLLQRLVRETPEGYWLRGGFYRRLGDLLRRTGKLEAALTAYAEAEALYDKEQDDLGRANVMKSRGDLLLRTGKLEAALTAYSDAEALFVKEQNDLGRANVMKSRGDLLRETGKPEEALATYAEAERLYLAERDDLGRANVLHWRGDILQAREDWEGAGACYAAAVPLYRAEQDFVFLCYTLAELQLCLKRMGKEAEGRRILRELRTLLPGQPENVQNYVNWKIKQAAW